MTIPNRRSFFARRQANSLRRAASVVPDGRNTREPRRLRVYLLWLFIFSGCAFLDASGGWGFSWLEGYFYDSASATLADLRPLRQGSDIVIVTLNDDTFVPDNPLHLPGPPVPRDYQAKLLNFLTESGAKAVAFDFLFDTSRSEDPAFRAAIERANTAKTTVILACLRDTRNQLLLPNDVLLSGGAKLGHILVERAPDRPTVDRLRGFINDGAGHKIPAMSLQMALVGRENEALRLPLGRDGTWSIRYAGRNGERFPYVPFEELVAPDADFEFYRALFRDKYVFVGDATVIGNDEAETPLGAMPGIEVHAHALSTLISQRFLHAAPDWLLAAIIGILSLPLALLHDVPRVRTLLWSALALAIGYTIAFVWLFAQADFALHLVGPLIALALLLTAILVERGGHEERERAAMFDALVLAASSAIESRDPATSGHSRRVTCLTVELAIAVSIRRAAPFRKVRYSRLEIKELCYSALLHDFGKIGVREAILSKSHKLEPLHFQAVQNRLWLLQSIRREECRKSQFDLLRCTPDDPQINTKLEELETQMHSDVAALEADRRLLTRANDPQVTYLPDADYAKLQVLLARLEGQKYRDAEGELHPLLTPEEKQALLIRKGSLTEVEFRQIQDHAQMSYDFLKQVKWTRNFENLAHIAWGHHEKLNGRGYPRGVQDEDIPLSTRMMTIADIFEALTSADRPYKKALPVERALKILQEEVDAKSLDADLFQVFLEERVYEAITDGRAERLLPTLFHDEN